ncbi:aconitate hydratase AcnA [Bradyrhizobium sp. Pear76]|uniref:aconitate hydratase AcnA n=1 Tax=Bradyrhizobium oropedii TaxID=1571201 RepID=UPI001E3381D3|nr:aconitate hydratase AcnA [Bradyrhizobium oropedii]MCC8961603.1 aconitate hydratase AcnA [Bradyrhizobium oropedii]
MMARSGDFVGTIDTSAGKRQVVDLEAAAARYPALSEAPRILLVFAENLLRHGGGSNDLEALLGGRGEVSFRPYRVLMQDYAGLPALLDIAGLREAAARVGRNPATIDIACPADLVIDHSIRVAHTGPGSAERNLADELAENAERFTFLKWAESAFPRLRVVPPGNGIVHQVNLERLGQVIVDDGEWIFPETLVGTDSHTPMINGLGVLGWGVGGLEATAAMLGLPLSVTAPAVTGVCLQGSPPEGVLATDIALALAERLRREDVVGQYLEFFGEGVAQLSAPDRATIANMTPEYGASASLFPVDRRTVTALRDSGRNAAADRVERYARQLGLWAAPDERPRAFSRVIIFDLSTLRRAVAGPSLPHQRLDLPDVALSLPQRPRPTHSGLEDGDIVIAAITSCTNTANPVAMITAGLLAQKALARGLRLPDRIKASLSPGSRAVTAYLDELGLLAPLQEVGFWLAGYGCMTCVGNSGDLAPNVVAEIANRTVAAILSGNRNFSGRIHPLVKASYLASPPLVVAYALAGTMRRDLSRDPIALTPDGPVFLGDLWPTPGEVAAALSRVGLSAGGKEPFVAGPAWLALPSEDTPLFHWQEGSSYLTPPRFDADAPGETVLPACRPLLLLGDNVTTDHISPVGRISPDDPAGQYLLKLGVKPGDFNSYGARRGNGEVMRRGTFANPTLENALCADQRGAWTQHQPSGEVMRLFDAAERYAGAQVPLVIVAGKAYGTGSARDWAAKGTRALGVRAVLAESFERIHRANLALVGVLPLQWIERPDPPLTGRETLSLDMPSSELRAGTIVQVQLTDDQGGHRTVEARCRLDTAFELECWRAGGMLARASEA